MARTLTSCALNCATFIREINPMLKSMNADPVSLEVSSVNDLKQQLVALADTAPNKPSVMVQLFLNDPQLIVRAFHVQGVTLKELGPHLRLEAVALLSLPLEEIELDYQVLSHKDDAFNGVFICLPKKNLTEYQGILDEAKVIPVQMSARSLIFMDQWLSQNPSSEQRHCVLEFHEGFDVYLGVFSQGQCELLRAFSSHKIEEIQEQIILSLRSILGQSRDKAIGQIICKGDIPQKEKLFSVIHQKFGVPVENVSQDIDLKREMSFFRLNLLKNYFLSLPERKMADRILNGLMVGLAVVALVLGILTVRNAWTLSKAKSSYKPSDVKYAQELEKQLHDSQHAK